MEHVRIDRSERMKKLWQERGNEIREKISLGHQRRAEAIKWKEKEKEQEEQRRAKRRGRSFTWPVDFSSGVCYYWPLGAGGPSIDLCHACAQSKGYAQHDAIGGSGRNCKDCGKKAIWN